MSNVSVQDTPPSPPVDSPFGHYRSISRDPIRFFQESSRTYGDIVHMRVGRLPLYLINHPDLIERMLVTDNRMFRKPGLLVLASETLGNGLLTSDGSFWLRQRRLAAPAFHRKRIDGYARTMIDTTYDVMERWGEETEVDLHSEMMGLTLEIVSRSLFGTTMDLEHIHRIGTILEKLLDRFMDYQTLTYALFDWFPRPRKLRFQNSLSELDTFIYDLINVHRSSNRREQDETLLGMYLKAQDDEGNGMSDQQLRDECVTIFLAGHETTANALTFTFHLLSQHPEVYQRLTSEVRSLIGDRKVTPEDYSSLPYTRQVITESMRLYPPAWRVGRENIEEYQLGDFLIPKGSQLFACQWSVHRDERWFDEPESFRPERWTDEFARSIPRYAYFPFGGGPRLCIGSAFAEMESVLVLATLLSRFEIHVDVQQPLPLYPSITLRPAVPISARAERISDTGCSYPTIQRLRQDRQDQ